MKIIGITGGIASGKSTVKEMLIGMSYIVIDSDAIAASLLEIGKDQYNEIVKSFGKEVLMPNKEINRKKLADIIFHNDKKKLLLNGIVHPEVKRIIRLELEYYEKLGVKLIFVDVPLLYEANFESVFDKIIVVYVDVDTQVQRLLWRDRITPEYALAKISSQMPLEEKKERADFVIDNSLSIITTKKALTDILEEINKEIE
jgi:dephospho-CoA kinase